ncbi:MULTISPECIES: hypothetical protein [unclassified Pseudoalteromonas]|uniref:hypothetical protein n=1 Tax=unclassified Pseudoalteromonas TaxID=194690 RepID=UPI00110ADCF6|nr:MULTISPECIES: hypothetical protein [unclassified Pseudoalteromonas]MDC9502630.1 hypothetical protein [Pseudoalteromonas sp. Angola-18]
MSPFSIKIFFERKALILFLIHFLTWFLKDIIAEKLAIENNEGSQPGSKNTQPKDPIKIITVNINNVAFLNMMPNAALSGEQCRPPT